MYMVYLVNGNEQIIIHDLEPSSSLKAVGKIKKAVNAIDSFTFTIYPGNPGYNAVVPLKSKIYVYNDIGDQIFAGRVLYPTSSMENTGAVKRTFVCEGELGYLCDTVQKYQSVGTTAYFFQRVLEQHNSQVGSDKQITLGTVTVNKESHRNTWGYVTSFQAINDYVKEYGGEFRLRYDSGTRYFDYTDGTFTSASDTPIELSVNMISVEYTVDPTKIASGIFAAGAKLNDSGISAERLELDDVIWDNTLISQYGKIVACETWDDVTTKSALTTKATAWLQDQSSEVKKFTVTAAQLYELSYGFDDFEVGTAYPIRNPLIGLDDTVRCVSKTIDINDPTKTTLTFGDRYTTIAQAIAETSNRSQEIGKITSSVGAMDASINNLKESTSGLATQVSDLTTRMTAAEAAISAISTDVIYSTTERKIGSWIDGDDLYEKTVVIPALGDGTTRSVQVAHGIADLGEVVESRGQVITQNGLYFPLQQMPVSSDGLSALAADATAYTIDRTNVTVTNGTTDMSGCKAYVTLRYTKSIFPSWVTEPSQIEALLEQCTKSDPWVLLMAEFTNFNGAGGVVYPHFQMAYLFSYRRGTAAPYQITQNGSGSSASYLIGSLNMGTTQYRFQNITGNSYPEWSFISSTEGYVQEFTQGAVIQRSQSYIMGIIDSSEGVTCPNSSDLTITDYR